VKYFTTSTIGIIEIDAKIIIVHCEKLRYDNLNNSLNGGTIKTTT